MTLSRRNLLKTAGLSSLAFVPLSQASAAGFDKEYDIVIIGAGGAGLAAACRAGELGLKAIVRRFQCFMRRSIFHIRYRFAGKER